MDSKPNQIKKCHRESYLGNREFNQADLQRDHTRLENRYDKKMTNGNDSALRENYSSLQKKISNRAKAVAEPHWESGSRLLLSGFIPLSPRQFLCPQWSSIS